MIDQVSLERIQALHPQPGDLFVLSCAEPLTLAQTEQIREQFTGLLPDGCKVAVLDGGLRLEAIAEADFSLLMGACFG